MNASKAALIAVVSVALIVLFPVFFLFKGTDTARADNHEPVESETVTVSKEITLPPLPPITVTIPGPTIRFPGQTSTIRLPGPTVTVPGAPGATIRPPAVTVTLPPVTVTQTVTQSPGVINRPSDAPTTTESVHGPSETLTESVSPSGQTPTERVTISPEPKKPDTETRTETLVKNAALGLLVTLGLTILGFIMFFVGYRFGFGDATKRAMKEERQWIRTLIPKRGQHQ